MPHFVQFPHPGGEHNPHTADMPWQIDSHGRKFLLAPGKYLDARGQRREADLVFWGEWEPPSRIEERWRSAGGLPRALHRPYWFEPSSRRERLNTDPWVWGERFLYSNCKQTIGEDRRATSMQKLDRGSVICFGSTIDGEFCLDTMFVVADRLEWVPASTGDLAVDQAFRVCTADSLATMPDCAHASFTLYGGATLENPVDGMFSFAPARRADASDARFRRPIIRHKEFINPSSRQSTRGSTPDAALRFAEVVPAWESVRDQVLLAELLLAVRLDTPPRKSLEEIPASVRSGC